MVGHDGPVPTGRYVHLDPHGGTPVAVEEFSCASGAAGWRYVSTVRDPGGGEMGRVDVTLDGGGRQVRVELAAGGWRLRGGVAGGETVWVRVPDTGRPVAEPGGYARVSGAGEVPAAGGAGEVPAAGGVGAVPAAGGVGAVPGGDPGPGRSEAGGAVGVERSARAAGLTGRSPAFLVATARLLRLSAGARARVRLVAVTEPVLGTRLVDEDWSLVTVATHPTETVPLPVTRYDVADLATGELRVVHIAGDVVVAAPALELDALHSPPNL